MQDYSTKKVSPSLVAEVINAIESINAYGSVEIYIQDSVVTQISVRSIKKTTGNGNEEREWRRERARKAGEKTL
ncbi:MAG: DUF2292 domain-containing protein [Patescibacteria group bacterium]